MTVSFPPLPSAFGTEVFSSAAGIARVKPAADPFFAGRSGVTTLDATYAGRIFAASLPEVVPSLRPSWPPAAAGGQQRRPHGHRRGGGRRGGEEASPARRGGGSGVRRHCVNPSWRTRTPGRWPSAVVSLRWNWPIGSGRPAEGARRQGEGACHQAPSLSKRFDVAARLSEHLGAHKARFDNSCAGRTITRLECQASCTAGYREDSPVPAHGCLTPARPPTEHRSASKAPARSMPRGPT